MNELFLCCIIHFIFYDNYNINITLIRIIISGDRSVQYDCQNTIRKRSTTPWVKSSFIVFVSILSPLRLENILLLFVYNYIPSFYHSQ